MVQNGKMIILQSEWDKKKRDIEVSARQKYNTEHGFDPRLDNARNSYIRVEVRAEENKYEIWDDSELTVLLNRMGHKAGWSPDPSGWWDKFSRTTALGLTGAESLEPSPMSATKQYKDYAKLMKEDPTGTFKKYLAETGLRGDESLLDVLRRGDSPVAEDKDVGMLLPVVDDPTSVTTAPAVPTPGEQKKEAEEATTKEQKDKIDELMPIIYATLASPDFESNAGSLNARVLQALVKDDTTGVYTAKSQLLYDTFEKELKAARERAKTTTKAEAEQNQNMLDMLRARESAHLNYRQALLTTMIQNPFKHRAATGQGLYLDPQNLGDYDRMDPFRKAQYGADLELIGETPQSIGRMVTPAGFARQVAPLVTRAPNVRRSV